MANKFIVAIAQSLDQLKQLLKKQTSAQGKERLKQKLSQREGFASYGAIQQWLKQICGLEVPYSTVHPTVGQTLKAKLKVPRPRSTDVDEHQQEAYKKTA